MAFRHSVLIVEDSQSVANLFAIMLRNMNIDPLFAASVDEATSLLGETRPDAMLLDLNLPGGLGWDVLDFAENCYGRGGVPTIVITGQSLSDHRRRADDFEIEHYFVKPIMPRTVSDALRQMLGLPPDGSHVPMRSAM